ncbi:MAG: hypothetical protein LAO20_20370 [Acidobacteriia bacterium]|nr:hypothetical protein [Terriglobia bacterium]
MPEGNIYMSSLSDQLGTMKFELTNINASGGPDFPLLRICTNIALHPWREYTQEGIRLRPISLIRAMGQLHSPEQRVVARFQEDILLDAYDEKFPRTTQVTFEIPLDLTTLTRIEDDRAGADLRIQLTFKLLFALHTNNGLSSFHSGRVDGLNFVIPRSQWVDHLLPGLGYQGLEVLEVRYGAGLIAQALPASVKEIQEAKKCLSGGQFDKSAVHCRKAIETILDSRPSSLGQAAKFRQRVETFIADNLTIDNEEAKLLSGQMQLIWDVASPQLHSGPAHVFKKADADFILRVTMAVIEYFNRLLT